MRNHLTRPALRFLAAAALAGLAAGCGNTGIGSGSRLESLKIVKLTGILGTTDNRVFVCFRDALQVQGTFTEGIVGDFSTRAHWTSSNPAVVQVSNGDIHVPNDDVNVFVQGTLIPNAVGTARITASYIGLTASYDVVVKKANSVKVTLLAPTMGPNTFNQAQALGDFDGYTVDVSGAAQWSLVSTAVTPDDEDGDGVVDTSDSCLGTPAGTTVDAAGCPIESLVTIAEFNGLIHADKVIPSPIVAAAKFLTCPDVSAAVNDPGSTNSTAPLNVATPDSLSLEREFGGVDGNLIIGFSDKLKITSHFADGNTQDMSVQSHLNIDPITVVALYTTSPNIVKALDPPGTATITACYDPQPTENDGDPLTTEDAATSCVDTDVNKILSNAISLSSVTGTLNSFTIDPQNPSITGLGTQQFHAIGSFDAGAQTMDITRHVVWASADPLVTLVSNNPSSAGEAFSLQTAAGSSGVTATSATDATLTATTTLCVYPPEVVDRPCPPPPPPP
jgi:hypothetical protein